MKHRNIFKDHHHITIIYNSDKSHDRKCYGAAKSMDTDLIGIDLSSTKVKSMEWLKIAQLLNLEPDQLLSKEHPDFISQYGDDEPVLDAESALKVLQNHPEVLIYPIAVRDDHALLLKSKHEIYQLDNKDK